MRREYLDIVLNHPDVVFELSEQTSRLSISPNWRLHQAGVADPVDEPFTLGAYHPNYVSHLGLSGHTGAHQVKVAILDNGFDQAYWQAASSAGQVNSGYDLIPGDLSSSGHGTLIAAIIRSSVPSAIIEPIRMGGTESTEWDALHALSRAVDLDADVVTLSYQQALGVDQPCGTCGVVRHAARSEVFERLLDWAANERTPRRAVLVAAGNDGIGVIARPASYNGAIAVAALDSTCISLASFSNWDAGGHSQVIGLPGESVAAGVYTGKDFDGTSFSTAYAAALFAEAMAKVGSNDADLAMAAVIGGRQVVSNSIVAHL